MPRQPDQSGLPASPSKRSKRPSLAKVVVGNKQMMAQEGIHISQTVDDYMREKEVSPSVLWSDLLLRLCIQSFLSIVEMECNSVSSKASLVNILVIKRESLCEESTMCKVHTISLNASVVHSFMKPLGGSRYH